MEKKNNNESKDPHAYVLNKISQVNKAMRQSLCLSGSRPISWTMFRVYVHDPYTHVALVDITGVYRGDGFAKRNPTDEPNEEVGLKLATSRAIHAYVAQFKNECRAMLRSDSTEEEFWRHHNVAFNTANNSQNEMNGAVPARSLPCS